jgi:membrane protein implicated in regulation of membrane protease activity
MKAPSYVVGWRKKDRACFNDERLKPAYWKVRFWVTWLLYAICAITVLIIYEIIMNDWLLAFCLLAFGGLLAVFFATRLRKRQADFNRLKDELGIVLERDENAVKSATSANVRRSIPSLLVLTGIFLFNSIMQFILGYWFLGILFMVLAAAYVAMTIYYSRKHRNEKGKDNSSDS